MAQHWVCSNSAYHADNGKIGSTMLRVALRSPAEYKRRYIDHPPLQDDPTEALILGSIFHALVLEPEKVSDAFAIRPEGIDGRTKEGKKLLAEFRLKTVGKQEVHRATYVQASEMAASLRRESLVMDLISSGVRERAIIWEEGGFWMKCKPDIFIARPEMESDLILDLKSDEDPTPEHWDSGGPFAPVRKYGYALQAAHYVRGMMEFTLRPCAFGTIVVGKSDPYEVFCYSLTPWLEVGETQRQRAIEYVRHGHETGWRKPEQGKIIDLWPRDWDITSARDK